MHGSMAGIVGGNVVAGSGDTMSIDVDWSTMLSSASIAVGWIGVDSSISIGARVEILSSVSFKNSVICMAVAVKSDGAGGVGRADTSVHGSSFAIFGSKIGISNSSSLAGSTSTPKVGRSSSSSAVSVCTEAVVGKGYA
uniref:Uncharacterized protein n=1 Tax=Romanomermis culicivorax TaxID=13658 RepID=A0A915JR44_ROMCU